MNLIISIDFIPGTHGHFLKYILNYILVEEELELPFLEDGTCHKSSNWNLNYELVHSEHYTLHKNNIKTDNIISIKFEEEDILKLHTIRYFRMGNQHIDDNYMHQDTYHKLKKYYSRVIETFNKLYNLNISENNPDCPRYILREFFKFGYKDPSIHRLILDMKKMNYGSDKKVYNFNYSSFYDYNQFTNELKNIENFFDLKFYPKNIKEIHDKFISYLTKYMELKPQADSIIESVKNNEYVNISNLTLFQESYINGRLELLYGVEMPFHQENYFSNTKEIIEWLNK